MSALPLAFGAPLILLGLIVLPIIWWLLRVTPPRPVREVFPPLKILAQLLNREETPNKSPWWLTLLRLLLAAFVILALSEPVWNPRPETLTGKEPVAIVLDNGWSSNEEWNARKETAERLIADAEHSGALIYILGTAEKANADIGPFDANAALERLRALTVRPIPVDRRAAFARLKVALANVTGTRIAYLNDGVDTPQTAEALKSLEGTGVASMIWYQPSITSLVAICQGVNNANGLTVRAVRPADERGQSGITIGAFDEKGRRIAETGLVFTAGEAAAEAVISAPYELRNDFHTLRIDGTAQAGGTYLIDDNNKRRRVALLSGSEADLSQPLLSPLYYISRALEPFADILRPRNAELVRAVPELLEQKPSVVIMADIGKLPAETEQTLSDWVDKGGTLVRFAGPRLAGNSDQDPLLPVILRKGERSLGGTLSWKESQPVAAFPENGPFGGLPTPQDVTVTRQVLAEPSADLYDKSWANLADGTPLVTGEARQRGQLVLFHVTPEATWSNLPISGSFVDMLHRIISLSNSSGPTMDDNRANGSGVLPPYLILSAEGALIPPNGDTKPLPIRNGAGPQVSFDNPPGFYGVEDAMMAFNLFNPDGEIKPLIRPDLTIPVMTARYAVDESVPLRGPLFALAALLLALDAIAILWLGGHLRRRFRPTATVASLAILLLPAILAFGPSPVHAQQNDSKPGDQSILEAVNATHLAYVITGDSTVDDISKAGLSGLSRALTDSTALEPGEPIGVNPATDELAFYPLIYWPIDAAARMPSPEAVAKIDAYMQQGGTVLFDTRDQDAAAISFDNSTTPANQRLRDILAGLNIPPLEPVPSDHVLTKSFYILQDFPGRYRGSPLWVQASLSTETRADRPVRAGDGVTPIMITGNDFAGAWATNADGSPLLPTIPNDPMQRTYAYRTGINIVMYMLTGNYKSDQVHVPDLLERLGN
ncbi:DUF4159 domain-containing protein [Phyllobacterium zundukense]|uniref:RNA-binding protein n=1 Tax=Phyllobacterium zundukense TaxID=1867719 RepID=A0A2N9VZF8_9HYPH|nr:DUF4159 domain-containing protein [Phyllobacterium zundukense]ATU90871.1 RNA-binding protein [Phyllobacterium zundukense]PIO44876.1 RNA-binding protein [Phyllobacterium zundukense]